MRRAEYRDEDGKLLHIDKVYGFVHTARKPKTCIACQKQIEKGTKYVQYNYPFSEDMIFHLECAVNDWKEEGGYLGIKREYKKDFYGIKRLYVTCRPIIQFNGGQKDA